MSDQNMTWQDVCRELLRLDAEGHEEPWREFEVSSDIMDWDNLVSLRELLGAATASNIKLRLKPRTVRVTTHNGETLELPEPWWDVPCGTEFYYVEPWGEVCDTTAPIDDEFSTAHYMIAFGNAFRSASDAQAWADAMPKIRGAK